MLLQRNPEAAKSKRTPVLLMAALMLAASYSTWTLADATLANFDSTHRSPGSFYVIFKKEADLASVARTGPDAPKVLPELLPTSKETTWRLATALCAEINAGLAGINFNPPHVAFITRDASDDAIRNILAKDPRIAVISANIETQSPR